MNNVRQKFIALPKNIPRRIFGKFQRFEYLAVGP